MTCVLVCLTLPLILDATATPKTIELDEILRALARSAERYREDALRFTCRETIRFKPHHGRARSYRFDYIYAFDDHGRLADHRVRNKRKKTEAPKFVDLRDYDLPVYVLRAYAAIFIFERDGQALYRYALRGSEAVDGRRAYVVSFEPAPPVVDDVNDWHGQAWVDAETLGLLRVEAMKHDAHEIQNALNNLQGSPVDDAMRTALVDEMRTEFDLELQGIRFPTRTVIDRTRLATQAGGELVRSPVFRVEQLYDRYEFFVVETGQEQVGSTRP